MEQTASDAGPRCSLSIPLTSTPVNFMMSSGKHQTSRDDFTKACEKIFNATDWRDPSSHKLMPSYRLLLKDDVLTASLGDSFEDLSCQSFRGLNLGHKLRVKRVPLKSRLYCPGVGAKPSRESRFSRGTAPPSFEISEI